MSDVFAEVSAELRRDRLQSLWNRYGLYVLAAIASIVLAAALVIGYQYWQRVQNEAASQRYAALHTALTDLDLVAQDEKLSAFIQAEPNGYGVLAHFSLALQEAEAGDFTVALAGFDSIAANTDLPDAVRDFARLQAAIILLDNQGSPQDIEARLADLLEDANGFRSMARDILALAWLLADEPLQARALYQAQLADETTTQLSKERAEIMFAELGKRLLSESN